MLHVPHTPAPQRARRLSCWLSVFLSVVACLLYPLLVSAQVLYGSLTGTVTDASALAVPGATVQAVNVETGIAKDVTTDERGAFAFNDLQPGTYKVSVTLEGFATLTQQSVIIQANRIFRLDARLQPKDVSETLIVTGRDAAIGLQTDKADVSITQTGRQVNSLPLTGSMGRNYQSLMTLVPGAVTMGEQNSAAGSPQRSISFNVNGTSRLQNNTRLDGSSVVYPWLPTNTAYVPSAEAIESVNIVTSSFDAEQGLAGGAAVNVALKSGTNNLHAVAWEYNTDSSLRARNDFQTSSNNLPDKLNQFGANAGGPIARNKLFFFFNWERSTREVNPVQILSVAPMDIRNGDFSGIPNVTIYDPASNADPRLRTPFPNNKIPADRIDPAALEMIRRLPQPTGAGYANNYQPSGVATSTRDNIDFKVTHQASDRLQMFGRYSISPTNFYEPSVLGDAGGNALNNGQLGNAPGRVQIAGVGGTYTLGSSVFLDANVGFTRQRLGAQADDIGTNAGLDILHIPGTNGPDPLQGGFPFLTVAGWSNMGNSNTGSPFLFRDNQYVATANLSWIKGAHNFRFGGDYQNQQLNHFQPQGGAFLTTRGSFGFNGNMTRLQDGPVPTDTRYNSWADFLLGLPNQAGKVVQTVNPLSVYMQAYALYARDQWQISRTVTLNYGLRYERFAWPTSDHGGVARFDATDGKVYIGGVNGVPVDTGASAGPGQFLPRAGVAWRVMESTVVRAGYGLSADPKPFIDFRNAYPSSFGWQMPNASFNGATNAFLPVTTLRLGLDEARYGTPPDRSPGVIPLPSTAGTTTWPKDVQRKYTHSYNVSVQRELGSHLTGQAAYVGTRVIGQMGFVNINSSAPGTGNAGLPLAPLGLTGGINSIQPVGDAFYDGLQTQLTYRSGGSQVGVAYTFSKAINYQDNDGGPRIQYIPERELNRGLAGFDRTHNLQTYWVLESPFGAGGKWLTKGVAGAVLGDWQFNGVLSRMSGTPIYIIQNNAGSLNANGSGQVPDQVLGSVGIFDNNRFGQPPTGGDPAAYQYFDRTAFAIVSIPSGQQQRFGNVGRNSLRGPGFVNLDLGLFRTFSLGGNYRIQFRAEALNVLNHPNLANPGADISNASTFGYITQTTGTGERNFRFGARFSF
jgi:hypothetical protein